MADGKKSSLAPQALGLAAAMVLVAQLGLAQKAQAQASSGGKSASSAHTCAKGSHRSKAFGHEDECSTDDASDLHVVHPTTGSAKIVPFGRTAACKDAPGVPCGPNAAGSSTYGATPNRR